jgi:iron complex outermembrane receptor protein
MDRRRRLAALLSIALGAGFLAAGSAAGADNAQLRGRVCSPDRCGIQGVTLTIRETATGYETRVVSGLSGTYSGGGLPAGTYVVTAEAPGFATGTVSGIRLAAGETRTVEVSLAFDSVQKVVTVIGTAPRGALQAAEARESSGRDLGEALTRINGIWKIRKGGIANDVVLRGFAGKDINVLIDGQRLYGACPNHMDPSAFHVDFSEVDRVEAAKGPFDIRNQGSLGGVLNVITRSAGSGVHGSLILASGAYGFMNPSATFSLGDGRFSALGGFSYRRSRPYSDPSGQPFTAYANYRPGVGDSAAFRAGSGWARVSFAPKAGQLIQVSYTRQEADHVLYPYLQMDAAYDNTDRINLTYEISPEGGPFKALRLQTYFSQVRHWMTDAFRLTSLDKPREYSMGTLAGTSVQGAKIEADTVHWTFGLEAYERGWKARTELAGMAYVPQYSIPDVVTDSLGGFVDYRTELSAGLSLAAGARLDVARSAADPLQANTDLYFAYHSTRSLSASDVFPSAHLQLTYAIATGLDFGLGVGHTVRIPDARERYFALKRAGTDWVGNPDLEVSRNTGLNASLSFRTGDLLLKGEAFTNDIRDFITVVDRDRVNALPGIMNTLARTYENIDAKMRGAEIQGSLTLARSWSFSTSLAYVRGTRPVMTETGVVTGNLPEIPPLSWRSVLRFDNGRYWGEIEGIVAARQSKVDTLLLEEATPGHELANARLGVTLKTVRIWVGLNNVFNARFVEHLSYFRDPFRSGTRVFEPGRNLFVSLDTRF